MTEALLTSNGAQVVLGRELGRGGEGAVFELPAFAHQVAKIYHAAPDPKKQAKLSFMASAADAELLDYVAWPQETLHTSPGGPVMGFIMPNVSNKAPVHRIYSPADRRKDYPEATWNFLVFVARNVAAAFAAVHAHGHVIGDVNQNSFMVGRDSKVMLVDSDSFQIKDRQGTLHLCGVGVAHFTPPELQSLPSFDGFVRTENHDNFGLALLIFHILFGGRHPFSGVPLIAGVGEALETDIKNFRYAYAQDNRDRGISPPPRSIPASMLPDAVRWMFQAAFTEKGVWGARPSALQWANVLDSLRWRLRKCGTYGMHVFPEHLTACPWCALEKQGIVYFIELGATFSPTPSGFVLEQVWAQIQAIQAPAPLNVPFPDHFKVTGLPDDSLKSVEKSGVIIMAGGMFITIVGASMFFSGFLFTVVFFVGMFMSILIPTLIHSRASEAMDHEKSARQITLVSAQVKYDQFVERLNNKAGLKGFQDIQKKLSKTKNELEGLANAEKMEIENLCPPTTNMSKQKFLKACSIDSANIPGVGRQQKLALRSNGIYTAADVSSPSLMRAWQLGMKGVQAMLDWRASCEQQYALRISTIDSQRINAEVRQKFANKRASLEAILSQGVGELQAFQQRSAQQAALILPHVKIAAKELAQAQADVAVLC